MYYSIYGDLLQHIDLVSEGKGAVMGIIPDQSIT